MNIKPLVGECGSILENQSHEHEVAISEVVGGCLGVGREFGVHGADDRAQRTTPPRA